jgi:hypothetical protein
VAPGFAVVSVKADAVFLLDTFDQTLVDMLSLKTE